MQTVLFLIDNSASMNQRCYLGTTLLDIAKGAVETFIKQRATRTDKYLLITFDEHPHGIKAGWKECQNHNYILNKLKAVSADGLTTFGQALKLSFDVLSVNRHMSGIDTYGQGRSPFYLEPSMIVAITDGGKLSNRSGILKELHLPMTNALPGSELTKEPFRWDQRLFSLVLRLPATPTQEPEQLGSVPSDISPISLMCEVTGGRSYCIRTHKTLLQCLDSLLQKVQSGVVIHFEREPVNDKDIISKKNIFFNSRLTDSVGRHSPGYIVDNTESYSKSNEILPWHSLHRMIYVRPNAKSGLPIGHWPLPESYCPDHNAPTLPPRTAHPTLRFRTEDVEPMLLTSFPYDKYELEPSPLTQVLLEKKNSNCCWVVYVENSGKQSNISHPCGYLKASTNLSCVNLFVMPYNYPLLLPLIEQLMKQKMKPSLEWRRMFDDYLKMLPPYYINPLRKSLKQIAAPNLIGDAYNTGLSYSVTVYFKKLKEQTKMAAERFILSNDLMNNKGVIVRPRCNSSLFQLPNFQKLLASVTGDDVLSANPEFTSFSGFQIGKRDTSKNLLPRDYHNPFDISRNQLLSHIHKMKLNFTQVVQSSLAKMIGSSIDRAFRIRLQDRHEVHNQPISQMGNYQDYVKILPTPLREANPDAPKRLHTFGNPFKLAKEKGIMIDETEDYDGPSATSGAGGRKRSSSEPVAIGNKRRCSSRISSKYSFKSPDKFNQQTKNFQAIASPSVSNEVLSGSNHSFTTADKSSIYEKENIDFAKTRNFDLSSEENKIIIPSVIEDIQSYNEFCRDIMSLIRKPGLQCSAVNQLLAKIKCPDVSKNKLIESFIIEAQRFKRFSLINLFEEMLYEF